VGAAIGRNPVSVLVPCHRVVGSTGKLTGYAGGLKIMRFLLDHEQACRGGRRDDLPLLFE
jgi:methylated-DNA-[protein]-cysteine S-methyltransferase